MGYYMRGDYYQRGDFFGGLVGGIEGAVKGFASGGLTGLVTGAISGANTGSRGAPAPPGGSIVGRAGKGAIAGLAFGNPIAGAAGALAAGPNGVPKGYHISKKTGKVVKNRHMNVANPRALSRAARRAHGFLRLSKRFVRYYTPKAHKGHAYIGAKRRRSR